MGAKGMSQRPPAAGGMGGSNPMRQRLIDALNPQKQVNPLKQFYDPLRGNPVRQPRIPVTVSNPVRPKPRPKAVKPAQPTRAELEREQLNYVLRNFGG